MRKILIATSLFFVLEALCAFLLTSFRSNEQILFPGDVYEVYALTDKDVGGFSVSELTKTDSEIKASVNIRSGMSYPYAGIGFNLMSENKRPAAGFFDFSRFDSIEVAVETGRMRNVAVRVLTNDPVYSKENVYASYRPLQKSVPVGKDGVKMSIHELEVPDRWFAALGMDENDGLKYFQRGLLLEISNGEKTMLGIPDEIKLKGVRLWGENHGLVKTMYALFVVFAMLWIATLIYLRRRK